MSSTRQPSHRATIPSASNLKSSNRLWVTSLSHNYPLALTLTLKNTYRVDTSCGSYYKRLTPNDCLKVAHRFQQKLNRSYFGRRGADKLGKSLKYLPVLEGVASKKELHLHYGVGGLPPSARLCDFESHVVEAISLVTEINLQYSIKIADSGWYEYMTKEFDSRNNENVLWQIQK